MHTAIRKHNILPGDRIVEPKTLLRIVHHHAIYVGPDKQGQDWIIENQFGHGVRLISADDYFRSVIEIARIEPFKGNHYERLVAVQKALKLIGRPYDLIDFNCEHFANYVQHGSTHSNQVNTAAKVGLVAIGVTLIAALLDDE